MGISLYINPGRSVRRFELDIGHLSVTAQRTCTKLAGAERYRRR